MFKFLVFLAFAAKDFLLGISSVSWSFGKDQSLSVDRRDLAVEKVMAFDEMSTKIEKLFKKNAEGVPSS